MTVARVATRTRVEPGHRGAHLLDGILQHHFGILGHGDEETHPCPQQSSQPSVHARRLLLVVWPGGDRILGDEVAHRLRDSFLFRPLAGPPGRQVLLLPAHLPVVLRDARPQLAQALVDLFLQTLVLEVLRAAKILQVLLQHALVGVERPVALDGILDDFLQLHAGRVESDQDGLALHVGRQRPDVLALQHVRDLEDAVAMRGRGDLGGWHRSPRARSDRSPGRQRPRPARRLERRRRPVWTS